MNEFAKRNFNLILFLSTIAGLTLPQPGEVSGLIILIILFFIIFSSSFKVDFSLAFFREEIRKILFFYLLRFIILPAGLFYLIYPFSTFYATCIFLLYILPAGVTAPAFANVFGGNISIALAILILSSSLTPFVLPLLGGSLLNEALDVDRFELFSTLFLAVILPYLLHLPLRKNKKVSEWMQSKDSFISIMGIAIIFALAIAEYRPVLLTQPMDILPSFLVGVIAFLGMYAFGWYIFPKVSKSDKIAFLFDSGANNVALGVVIAFLYFPVETGVFFVIGEVVWVLVLIPIRKWLTHVSR